MLEVERFEKIMEYLREKKTAPVNVLAKRLFVSEATMRRDLSELERKGLVKRLHGGAILLDGANQELPLYLRERQNTDAKRIISEKASHHIVEGQTIFLDASSTAEYRKAVRSPMHPGKRLTFVRSCCNKAAHIFFYVIIIKSVRSIATTYVMYHSWTIILPTCNYSELFFPVQSVQFSIPLHALESLLSQCLVEHDGYGIGQIQGTDLGKHRDTDAGLFMLYQDLFRDSGALLAEHDIVVRSEFHIGVGLVCFRGCHPDLRSGMHFLELLKIHIPGDIQMLPVVHTGSLDLFFI